MNRYQRLVLPLASLAITCGAKAADAAGAFAAPVQNTFSITFDNSSATSPGPQEFRTAGFADNWDNGTAGERASWGSFGGNFDSITASIVENVGPNGTGDHAARLEIVDATPTGGYFSSLLWQVKGLRLGNSTGATASGGEPIPDFDAGLAVTVPVKVSQTNARFRINFDTGSGVRAGRYFDPMDPSADANGVVGFTQGNVPGLIDNFGTGSRIVQIGPTGSEIGVLPVNTWGTQTTINGVPLALNENPSQLNGWSNATFEPAFGRAPRSNDLTRVGVTFPGAGGVGELLVAEWTMTGTDVLKYHAADFNIDQQVNALDIDELYSAIAALALNESLSPVPDVTGPFGVPDGVLDFKPVWGTHKLPWVTTTLPEKYSITKTDNTLNLLDVEELVEVIMGTSFGDVDLDGDVDTTDLGIASGNLNMPGGWAMGDVNGDKVVNAADIAIINAGLPSSQAGDFSGDGRVDGADLSLLLANWGATVPPTPSGWNGVAPTATGVDADELSALLANWGVGTSTSIPEPGTAALLLSLVAAATRRRFA